MHISFLLQESLLGRAEFNIICNMQVFDMVTLKIIQSYTRIVFDMVPIQNALCIAKTDT